MLPSVAAGLVCGGFYLNVHRQAAAMSPEKLPLSAPTLGPDRRLLILSPHCDDETLGVGGLIAEASASKTPVTVAFLTNGDGFRVAAVRTLHKPVISPADFVKFAEIRQREALAAQRELGVPEKNVVFLGYPDRGLLPMWEENWRDQAAFRSPFTNAARSPYKRCQTKGALYSGETLVRDLAKLISRTQPTDLYVTHPADDHPDHSAAASFAQAALDRVIQSGGEWARKTKVRYYIVHRGDWPLPQGLYPDQPLLPPPGMASLDTRWERVPLTTSARDAKSKALSHYTSQLALTSRFLTSFVRANELFGSLTLRADARDATGDNLARYANPAADITRISARRDGAALKLRVRLGSDPSSSVRYALKLRSEAHGGELEHSTLTEVPLRAASDGVLEGAVPLDRLAPNGESVEKVWVAAETFWHSPMALDRTGYRVLHVE